MRHLLLPLLFAASIGCGTSVYMPSQVAHFDPDGPATEIDDQDVAKAFAARPQLGDRLNVAYFSFDASKNADVERVLHAIPGVGSVYSIPALAVTGARRFDAPAPEWQAPPARPFSMKKLRLLAARAHCDVVVVVDYGYRTDVSANGLAAFDALLVPALFLPFRDVKVQSYVDAFLVDTRNGYLYGETTSNHQDEKKFQTLYADDSGVVAAQWDTLKTELQDSLVKVVEAERSRAKVVAPDAAK